MFGKLDPMLINSLDFDFFVAAHGAVEPGDREAALEGRALGGTTKRHFFAGIENGGVEVDFDAFFKVGDKATQIIADLGEGEADPLGVVGVFHGRD